MCVAFQVTQSGRQSRVSKSWWLTEVERDGDINHCHPLKRAKRHISNQHRAASWGRRGDMRSSWQLTGPLCVTAEKPGQDTRIWAPGWMHAGWADPSCAASLGIHEWGWKYECVWNQLWFTIPFSYKFFHLLLYCCYSSSGLFSASGAALVS